MLRKKPAPRTASAWTGLYRWITVPRPPPGSMRSLSERWRRGRQCVDAPRERRWPRRSWVVDVVKSPGKAVGVRLVRYTGKSRHCDTSQALVNARGTTGTLSTRTPGRRPRRGPAQRRALPRRPVVRGSSHGIRRGAAPRRRDRGARAWPHRTCTSSRGSRTTISVRPTGASTTLFLGRDRAPSPRWKPARSGACSSHPGSLVPPEPRHPRGGGGCATAGLFAFSDPDQRSSTRRPNSSRSCARVGLSPPARDARRVRHRHGRRDRRARRGLAPPLRRLTAAVRDVSARDGPRSHRLPRRRAGPPVNVASSNEYFPPFCAGGRSGASMRSPMRWRARPRGRS